MTPQASRNLAFLENSASTARVLNLLRVHRRASGADPDHASMPFFKNPILNKSIILKHRLRLHEKQHFSDGRSNATKIILALDGKDLSVGGQSVFVGEKSYEAVMLATFGKTWLEDTVGGDREMLSILDELPSFDPFLVREYLKRHNREPARCYFEISEGDMARMYAFVEAEIQQLIDLCYSDEDGRRADGGQASRLVQKILSNAVDAETEPLRLTLRLEKREYQEGVFCWKGFLYYKWSLAELLDSVAEVSLAISTVKPVGAMDTETKASLEPIRGTLVKSIGAAIDAARHSLSSYDRAFASLIDGKPQGFRDFLLHAPEMFCDLGEQLGAVSHIVSFWRYRFPPGKRIAVGGVDLYNLFVDFEGSLVISSLQGRPSPTSPGIGVAAA
jgi:hypothetical protein